ncbi:MAG TPA: hypothetical protein VFY64_10590 [Nitrososphaeraceae archaeon]|nr:hypothetical protein [Nitrososphaeraceae archaeon]
MVDSEAFMKRFYDHADKVKRDEETNTIREQEISRREKALERELEDHLKNGKLTPSEIRQIRTPSRVF